MGPHWVGTWQGHLAGHWDDAQSPRCCHGTDALMPITGVSCEGDRHVNSPSRGAGKLMAHQELKKTPRWCRSSLALPQVKKPNMTFVVN